jgi:hypothetical protein
MAKDRDFFVNARRVVERAIGEQIDGNPLKDPDAGKNRTAVALGREGGKKGGKARAAKLSAEERSAIAKKAASARSRQHQSPSPVSGCGSLNGSSQFCPYRGATLSSFSMKSA